MKEKDWYYDGQFTRQMDGRWRDFRGEVFDRKRDALEANTCDCRSCKNKYEDHMRGVMERETQAVYAITFMNCYYWLIRGYEDEDLEVFPDGSVFPVKKMLEDMGRQGEDEHYYEDDYDDEDDYGQEISDDGFSALL